MANYAWEWQESEETLVEARGDTDARVVRETWEKEAKRQPESSRAAGSLRNSPRDSWS